MNIKGCDVYKLMKNKCLLMMMPSSYAKYAAKSALENMLYNIFVT